ncbi:MAG: peptidoglycan-binding domain-containing protein [Candidatus Acidiferrales bacterium]
MSGPSPFARSFRGRAVKAAFLFGLGFLLLPVGIGAQSSPVGSSHLVSSKKKSKHSKRAPKQKAPTPDRIEEIQSALGREGFYGGDPSRKWDARTVAALKSFQSANGMPPTGKLDAESLQKLGLGSDIAGVAAPKTATPAAPASPAVAPTTPSAAPAAAQTPAPSKPPAQQAPQNPKPPSK